MNRWCISASIYTCSEILSSYISERPISQDRTFRTVACGATADAVFLRAYHIGIDQRIKSPLVRMGLEQICIAPFYDAGYLTVVKGSSWSFDDFWTYEHCKSDEACGLRVFDKIKIQLMYWWRYVLLLVAMKYKPYLSSQLIDN